MISLLASKCQDFKLRGLQFHFIKQLKIHHSNFKDFNMWRYAGDLAATMAVLPAKNLYIGSPDS